MNNWKIDIDVLEREEVYLPKSFQEIESKEYKTENDFETLEIQLSLLQYNFYFRGHSNTDFKLLSSAARFRKINTEREKEILQKFKESASLENCVDFKLPKFDDDLFYMSIARHLGLTCRILDWTKGFWKALSFLLYDNNDSDGTLWIMAVPKEKELVPENRSPFVDDGYLHILKEDYYLPDGKSINDLPLGNYRCFVQNGVFTVTSTSLSNVELNKLCQESLRGIQFIKINVPVVVKTGLGCSNHLVSVSDTLYSNRTS